MSEDPTSPTRTPTLFAEDSLVSHSVTPASSRLKTTPDISGQRCLGLSGNAGPLGLLEKTLLESSAWAWTKYSLTWRAKATPQGRLIFQLARLEPRTSGSGSGLLHTPTAKANQMAPSMATRDSGSWGLGLWPTPTASAHRGSGPTVVRKDGKIRNDRLDYAVEQFWPTPDATPRGAAIEFKGTRPSGAKEALTLETAVTMWPTPRAQEAKHGAATEWELRTDHAGTRDSLRVQVVKRMWPTPNAREKGGGEYQDPDKIKARMEKGYQANLGDMVKLDQKSGGQLSPLWVAWLMGYPTEYLNSVPWETPSSRKSQKKSETQ